MKRNMRGTYVLLFCSVCFHGESSKILSSYTPRSETLEGVKQQHLQKDIDGQIKKFKATVGSHHKSSTLHSHKNRSNTTSNPFVRQMQELLNGTRPEAVGNITTRPESPQGTEIKRAKAGVFGESPHAWKRESQTEYMKTADADVQKQKEQIKKESNSSQLRNASNSVANSIQQMVADANATAKELNINISHPGPTPDAKMMHSEPKDPTHAEIQKSNQKIFGEASNAWKRESKTQQMQKTDRNIQKQVDQAKNHSNLSRQSTENHMFAKAVERMAHDVQEVIDAVNASKKNLTNRTNQTNFLAINPGRVKNL
jgi:hypothetical protein